MSITIPLKIYNEMIKHALAGKPNEICGILGGKDKTVCEHYVMTNVENSPESYLMDPKEQYSVQKDLRSKGLYMLAIYHSHPSSPARPSKKDIDMAFYPDVAYIIISLENLKPDVKAFIIKNKIVSNIEIKISVS